MEVLFNPSVNPAIRGLMPQQGILTAPVSFRDLVQHFMWTKQPSRPQADDPDLLSPPLGPHLELKLARARQLGTTALTGSQPVAIQTRQIDSGSASRLEIRSPQIHADGTVTYNVSSLQLAIPPQELLLRPELAQGTTVAPHVILPAAPIPTPFLRHWDFKDRFGESEQLTGNS
ncbi:MAG: hypothetical protein ACAI44_34660 [Candidatus Sericytochromatia bacterium]